MSTFDRGPEIVEWVNETFAGILPAEDDPASGAVAFSKSIVAEEYEDGQECVQVHGFLDAMDEAERVVELVKAAGDGKVAVLVRARSHLIEIVGILKQAGIPFQAIEIDQLGERPVIEDLMALTLGAAACCRSGFVARHPARALVWVGAARSARARGRRSPSNDLGLAASRRFGRSARTEQRESGTSCRFSIRRLPSAGGGRCGIGWKACGSGWAGPPASRTKPRSKTPPRISICWRKLAEGADLADFDWFREQVNALFAQPDARAGDRLQLMTIHKAKGLEFDTVILPGLGAIPRPEEQRLLLWLEQSGALLLAPISEAGQQPDPIYTYLSRVEERKMECETARLLYVATTRARDRLHLLGTVKTKEDGSIAEPPSKSLLKLLWPAVAQAFDESIARGNRRRGAGRPEHPPRGHGLENAVATDAVEWTRQEIETIEIAPVPFEWVSQSARYAGTALHGLMQRIAREGLEAWDENAVRSRRGLYQSVLSNLGVPPGELTEAAERVETALLRTLRDPKGRWILRPPFRRRMRVADHWPGGRQAFGDGD